MYNIALLSYHPLLQHMNRRKSPAQLMDRQFCLKWVLKQYRKVCWGGAQMPTDRCFNSVRKLGFPPWDQLKGIVGTVEVLAYKAMSFAMDHFALECVCGSIFQCMFGGFFFFFFFFFFACVHPRNHHQQQQQQQQPLSAEWCKSVSGEGETNVWLITCHVVCCAIALWYFRWGSVLSPVPTQ